MSYRKIDICHGSDRSDQKPSANFPTSCVFLLSFLNGLSYCYRSKLVRSAFQKRFECQDIEIDSFHGFEMRRSTPVYFILITTLGIATFFAKKLDLQPLGLVKFQRETEIKTVDAFIMIKGKFPEIFSQFYGFPAVSLGHHTVNRRPNCE